ncbi:hypothetical protein [Lentzea sp. E54]|uniref:hypothetical protein n=1 Tax=Lentzea xerophila TaxID=3435883 RepID=UPI003DA40E56
MSIKKIVASAGIAAGAIAAMAGTASASPAPAQELVDNVGTIGYAADIASTAILHQFGGYAETVQDSTNVTNLIGG